MRFLGTRHYRLSPHLFAVTASWFLNIVLTIYCVQVLVDRHIVGRDLGDAFAAGAYGCAYWLCGLILYQTYGFLASRGRRVKVLVFVAGSFVAVLLASFNLNLGLLTTESELEYDWMQNNSVLAVPLYSLVIMQSAFWGMLLIETTVARCYTKIVRLSLRRPARSYDDGTMTFWRSMLSSPTAPLPSDERREQSKADDLYTGVSDCERVAK